MTCAEHAGNEKFHNSIRLAVAASVNHSTVEYRVRS